MNFSLEISFPSVSTFLISIEQSASLTHPIRNPVRTKEDSGVPCDLLLLRGSCIVNEAMLSGESTPLLKESVELRPGTDSLDIDAVDRNSVLFGGTKVLQATGIDVKETLAGECCSPIDLCGAKLTSPWLNHSPRWWMPRSRFENRIWNFPRTTYQDHDLLYGDRVGQ